MTIAVTAPAARRTRLDLSWPILIGFALILCALIVLPMSWLVYFSFTPECQQLIIDIGGLRSMHPQTKEKPGRTPFKDIKTMKDDAAAVETMGDEIKQKYVKIFRV